MFTMMVCLGLLPNVYSGGMLPNVYNDGMLPNVACPVHSACL